MERLTIAPEKFPAYDLSGVRALIVDRYAAFTRIFSELLVDFGVEPVVAHTRAEALAAIRYGGRFDVLAVGGDSDVTGGTVDLPAIARRHLGEVLVVSLAACPGERRELINAGADLATDKSTAWHEVVAELVRRRESSGVRVAVRN